MTIAIITGASSGLGREYALALAGLHPEIEEYWLVARRKDRLETLSREVNRPCRILPLDLTCPESMAQLGKMLKEEQPRVKYLVNNSGYGKLGDLIQMPMEDAAGMVELNCAALTRMTSLTLPYMPEGSAVINVCSIAAFAPNPRMAVYSATKAYVFSLSKALGYELKPRKIAVTAVCPGPMDTEFLAVANIPGRSRTFDMLPRVNPRKVAEKSIRAADKGRAVYTNHPFYKFYRVLGKLLPHNWVMPLSKC